MKRTIVMIVMIAHYLQGDFLLLCTKQQAVRAISHITGQYELQSMQTQVKFCMETRR